MGKRKINELNPYDVWISSADKLVPPYDYFSFANLVSIREVQTNSAYMNLLHKTLTRAKGGASPTTIVEAINMFKSKNTSSNSDFSKKYDLYWTRRSEDNSRQRANNAINDIESTLVEVATKRIKSNAEAMVPESSSSTTDNKNNGDNEDDEDNEDNSLEVAVVLNSNNNLVAADDNFKIAEQAYQRITGVPFINIDEKESKDLLEEEMLSYIKEKTNLKHYNMSPGVIVLLNKLKESPASAQSLKKIIRKSIGESIDLDGNEEIDVAFIENVGTYYVNLLLSPQNPLSTKLLERTAAVHTVVFLINNLFLDVNDIISFKWFEVLANMTNNVKWDGIGFTNDNMKLTPVLIEMSGGLKHNNVEKKECDDICKLVPGAIKAIEYTAATSNIKVIPQFIVRVYDTNVYLESIVKFNENMYIRRTYIKVPTPSSPRALQRLFSKVPEMLSWREAVVGLIKAV